MALCEVYIRLCSNRRRRTPNKFPMVKRPGLEVTSANVKSGPRWFCFTKTCCCISMPTHRDTITITTRENNCSFRFFSSHDDEQILCEFALSAYLCLVHTVSQNNEQLCCRKKSSPKTGDKVHEAWSLEHQPAQGTLSIVSIWWYLWRRSKCQRSHQDEALPKPAGQLGARPQDNCWILGVIQQVQQRVAR